MIFTNLTLHRIRVDLAHVLAPILFLYILDVEVPSGVIVVRNRYSGVVCDRVVVNSLNRLGVSLHPAHLCMKEALYYSWLVEGTSVALGSSPTIATIASHRANEISIPYWQFFTFSAPSKISDLIYLQKRYNIWRTYLLFDFHAG